MQGVEESHLNAVISVVMKASFSLWESTIEEALRRLSKSYGKKDTLGMDAAPEITIKTGLGVYDKFSIVVTEEADYEFKDLTDHRLFRTVFICDPTDRSSKIKEMLMSIPDKTKTVSEVIDDPEFQKKWEDMSEKPMRITGGSSAVTCVRRGVPIFSVIANYMTRQLFLACDAGCYCFSIPREERKVDFEEIASTGNKIFFNGRVPNNEVKKFTTYMGNVDYRNNFIDSGFMTEKDMVDNLVYDIPGGPSRVLYLSDLQEFPMGFIMANGEKITEWIHWLPYVRFARRNCNQGDPALQLFEVYHDRPWTKDNILMSTPPAYSIFKSVGNGKEMVIDVGRFPSYGNPSKIRSTLIVCPVDNQWATRVVSQYKHRAICLYAE
ncbi:MAG: hypothetical protein MNSN_08900 [Minisyncoccus archaeiphilus]|jgi:hypothetical protein|uniref:hypothetical protein n=1 Tax=Minisyncoccus archaeiphilus TaxID=3238481 RepID=UPI002B0B66B8|nr:MAG: hypothetical protein MNSN_08900 [Candidatus Parcubacteria bacterium]